MSFMSSSLLLQPCPVCLVRRTWMVLEMGGRWSYNCCLVRYCFQDLFSTARSNLVQYPSKLVSVHVVHPYNSMDTTAMKMMLSTTYYYYDMALLANTIAHAESWLHSLEKAVGGKGLHVNADKTKYICFNQKQKKKRHLHAKTCFSKTRG